MADLQNTSNKNKGIGDAINLKKTSKKAAKRLLKNTEVSQEKNLKVDHLLSRLNLMTLKQ